MTSDYLTRCFKVPSQSKTLKLKKLDGFTLEEAVRDAYKYVSEENTEGIGRVEFRYAGCYIVVARLK